MLSASRFRASFWCVPMRSFDEEAGACHRRRARAICGTGAALQRARAEGRCVDGLLAGGPGGAGALWRAQGGAICERLGGGEEPPARRLLERRRRAARDRSSETGGRTAAG